jgi:hypothetical protein
MCTATPSWHVSRPSWCYVRGKVTIGFNPALGHPPAVIHGRDEKSPLRSEAR